MQWTGSIFYSSVAGFCGTRKLNEKVIIQVSGKKCIYLQLMKDSTLH